MAIEDRNGALHSESNGQFVSKGKSDEKKIKDAERVYNTHGHLNETLRVFANGLRQPRNHILTTAETETIKNEAGAFNGYDEIAKEIIYGKQD